MTRWERISGYLQRHGDADGWVLWSTMVMGLSPLSAPQITNTLSYHQDDVEYRVLPPVGRGRPRREIRLV